MLHDAAWFDRLLATGKLNDYRVKDEWFQWKTSPNHSAISSHPRPGAARAHRYAMISRLMH